MEAMCPCAFTSCVYSPTNTFNDFTILILTFAPATYCKMIIYIEQGMTVPLFSKTENVEIIIKIHWKLTIYQSLKYKLPNMQFEMYNLMYSFSPQPVESVPSTMRSYSFVLLT